MEMELKDLLKVLLDSATKSLFSQSEVFNYVSWFVKKTLALFCKLKGKSHLLPFCNVLITFQRQRRWRQETNCVSNQISLSEFALPFSSKWATTSMLPVR